MGAMFLSKIQVLIKIFEKNERISLAHWILHRTLKHCFMDSSGKSYGEEEGKFVNTKHMELLVRILVISLKLSLVHLL